MKKIVSLLAVTATLAFSANAATLFSENFDALADGTAISTSNTAFTFVRVSGGAGSSIVSKNPGSFTAGSLNLLATSTSISAVGVSSGLPSFTSGEFSFSLKTPATLGTLFFGAGTGTTFTGNSTFAGADLLFGFQITSAGLLQTRDSSSSSGAWVTIGNTIAGATSYTFDIQFNNSGSDLNYSGGTVATGKSDVYVNGVLVGDDVSLHGTAAGTAFRIYTTGASSATPYELDSIALSSAAAVPEPSTLAGLALGSAFLLARRRRALSA